MVADSLGKVVPSGGAALAVPTDITKASDVADLAEQCAPQLCLSALTGHRLRACLRETNPALVCPSVLAYKFETPVHYVKRRN